MRFQKTIIVLFITVAFLGLIDTNGEEGKFRPILPNGVNTFGGDINIGKDYVSIKPGIILDDNLDGILDTSNTNCDFIDNKCFLTIPSNHADININGFIKYAKSFLVERNGSSTRLISIMSENANYLPKNNIYYYFKDITHQEGTLVFYDPALGKDVYKIKNMGKNPTVISISKSLILVDEYKNFVLYNIKDWSIITKCNKSYYFDEKSFVTKDVIVDIEKPDVVVDISQYNLSYAPILDEGDLIVLSKPDSKKNDYFIANMTRDGQMSGYSHVVMPDYDQETESIQIYDINGRNMLGFYLHQFSMTYIVFNVDTGNTLWSKNYPRGNDFSCMFYKSNLVEKSPYGWEVYDLQNFKLIKSIPFAKYASFVLDGTDKYVVTTEFDKSNKPLKVVYKIDDNNRVILSSRTLVSHDNTKINVVNNIVIALKFSSTLKAGDNNTSYINTIEVTCHKVSSTLPYKSYIIGYDTGCKDIPTGCVNGSLFFAYHQDRVEIYDLISGKLVGKLGLYNFGFQEDAQAEPTFYRKGGNLYVHTMTKSLSVVKRNHLYCFDMVSGVLIYDVEISPTTRVLQVTQDSILLDTNYNHSENNILRTDKKNLTIPGAFAIDDNYVYYSYCASNDIINKTNTEYCKYNLQDGSKISVESNSCYNSTTFTNNVVFYISDKGFVSKDGGEIIQNNLGDLNLLNEQSNCYNLLFRYYQNSNSVSYGNIIVNVEPCPTYSIKRSGELSFDITMTNAGIDKIIQGNAYLVGCDDTGELPIFTQLNQKYELVLASNGKCSFTISKDYLNSTKSKYFALIIETNGLLDTTNSELSDFDKKNKPLFDGTSISYDEQKSVVVTVWENK